MPRLELAVVTVSRNAVIATVTPVLAVDGAQFQNDGQTCLMVDNNTGGAKVITFLTPGTVGQGPALAIADHAYTIASGPIQRWLGPWPTGIYNQVDGKVYLDVSVDGISIRPIKVPG